MLGWAHSGRFGPGDVSCLASGMVWERPALTVLSRWDGFMNQNSSKDFKELNPDDVIYIGGDQQPTPPPVDSPPADPPPEKTEEAEPKPPAFEIPVLEKPDRVPEPPPPQPAPKEAAPEPDLPEIEEPAQPDPPADPPTRQEEADEPAPTEASSATETPSPDPPPDIRLPEPPEIEEPPPPVVPIAEPPEGAWEEPPPESAAPPSSDQSSPAVRSVEEEEVLPPPSEPALITDIIPPPPAPPELPPPPPEPLSLPAVAELLPPAPEPETPAEQPSLATTDLQGNWGSPATLSPPAAIPIPAAEGSAESEEKAEEEGKDETDTAVAPDRRGTKHLKIFGIATLGLIAATVVVGVFFLRPYLQEALESKRSEDAEAFEDVLVNMLQVDNQQLKVEITDNQLQQIQPLLDNQEEIEGGKVIINNVMKVDYAPDFSRPVIVSKFRFDLDLQTTDRDNFIIDVVTVFNGQGTYFMIESLSIKGEQQDLSQTEFAGRWSDLEALSQVQSASEDAPLESNQSFFLSYVANLLKLYSHPHYLFIFPVFNIVQSKEYTRTRDLLLQSEAYYLHTGSCKRIQGGQRSCQMTVDYEQLYQLYADIYEVLDTELPSYYDILLTAGQEGSNLPRTVVLTFDAERDRPILLEAPVNEGEISASRLEISYDDFDVSQLDLPAVSDPLDLAEYHRQILEYETQQLR